MASKTPNGSPKMTRLQLVNAYAGTRLFIVDVPSLATASYMTLSDNRSIRSRLDAPKPELSIEINGKTVNVSVIYYVFKLIASLGAGADYLFSFTTSPNSLQWLRTQYQHGFLVKGSDYYYQLNGLRYLLHQSHYRIMQGDGVNANALISKAVALNSNRYANIFIFSNDDSLFGMVNDKVKVIRTGNRLLDMDTAEDIIGCPPGLYNLYRILVGTKQKDGNKGLKGFGAARFKKMVVQDNLDLLIDASNLTLSELITNSTFLKDAEKQDALRLVARYAIKDVKVADANAFKAVTPSIDSYLKFLTMFQMTSTYEQVKAANTVKSS